MYHKLVVLIKGTVVPIPFVVRSKEQPIEVR